MRSIVHSLPVPDERRHRVTGNVLHFALKVDREADLPSTDEHQLPNLKLIVASVKLVR